MGKLFFLTAFGALTGVVAGVGFLLIFFADQAGLGTFCYGVGLAGMAYVTFETLK